MKQTQKAALLAALLCLCAGCGRADDAPQATEPTVSSATAGQEEAPRPAYRYAFDPHVIAEEYEVIYGPEIRETFFAFCDAVLGAEDSFPCVSFEQYHQLLDIARTCLPVAWQVVDREKARVENGVGYLTYRMDREAVLEAVRAFREKVSAVITAAVPYEDGEAIFAIELLTAVARKDHFDEEGETLENALQWNPCRAIMEDVGICQEIAGEYIYYLLQVGINAVSCSALSRDQTYAHEWALVRLDGAYYHVDPTFTIEYPDSLAFFAMDDAMRERYGDFPAENFTYADSDRLRREDYKAESKRFQPLWRAASYEINRAEGSIRFTTFPGEDGAVKQEVFPCGEGTG